MDNTASLYRRAMALWGKENQEKVLVEECAELIVAINHRRRDKCDDQAVIGELLDVQIMVEQMLQQFAKNNGDYIKRRRSDKLHYLEGLLNKAEQH